MFVVDLHRDHVADRPLVDALDRLALGGPSCGSGVIEVEPDGNGVAQNPDLSLSSRALAVPRRGRADIVRRRVDGRRASRRTETRRALPPGDALGEVDRPEGSQCGGWGGAGGEQDDVRSSR